VSDDARDEIESLAVHLFDNRAHPEGRSLNSWQEAGQVARAFYRKLARDAMAWTNERFTCTRRSEHG
jgi:hypothetical protein